MSTQPVNQRLAREILSHEIGLHRYADNLVREMIRVLDEADMELVRQIAARKAKIEASGQDRGPQVTLRLERMLEEIRAANLEAHKVLGLALGAKLQQLAAYENEWAAAGLESSLPFRWSGVRLTGDQLAAIVMDLPMVGHTLPQELSLLAASRFRKIQGAMQLGMSLGETIDQMVRRVVGTAGTPGILEITKPEAVTLVRTAANHVANATRSRLYSANSDVLKGVQWLSTLDAKTTPICRGLDRKVFPLDSGPRPPAHYRCRSTVTPITKSAEELGAEKIKVPRPGRASMDGQVAADQDYTSWLRGKPAAFQDEILGKARGAIFRANPGMDLADLMRNYYEELTLEELVRMERLTIPDWLRAAIEGA